MQRILRGIGYTIGGLVTLLALAFLAVYGLSELRLRRSYDVVAAVPTIPTDAASIAHGKHLAGPAAHCLGCHTNTLAGQKMIDAPPFALVTPNLTSGAGGVGTRYTDADWVRAITHGVRPDGTPLLIMPSHNYHQLTDADLGALIAYLKSAAPVDNDPGRTTLRPLGRLLLLLGELPLSADQINHLATRTASITPARDATYGRYLSVLGNCADCHGATYAGQPSIEPGAPPASNLTPGGELRAWSEQDFIQAMRTGKRPDGRPINPAMPWETIGELTDDELGAIYRYLQTLPPQP